MRYNLLSIDVFIGTPGALNSNVLHAMAGIAKTNEYTIERNGISFNARHWTQLKSRVLRNNEQAQDIIDEKIIDKCDVGIFIFTNNTGSRNKNNIPFTLAEMIKFRDTIINKLNPENIIILLKKTKNIENIELKTQENTLKDMSIFKVYSNDDEIINIINLELIKIADIEYKKNSFIQMPINNSITSQEVNDVFSIYYNEQFIVSNGKKLPYTPFFESIRSQSEIENLLQYAILHRNEFQARVSSKYRARHKLFQSQILIKMIESDKLRENNFIVRLIKHKNKIAIQKTTYDQQVISNLSLFWPPVNDISITGRSGLYQIFGPITDRASPEATNLKRNFENLNALIKDEENLNGKMPNNSTKFLANTLGVANIIYFSLRGDKIYITRKVNENNAINSGKINFASTFPLPWNENLFDKTKETGKEKGVGLWEYIKKEAINQIQKSIRAGRDREAHGHNIATTSIDKISLKNIKVLNLLREAPRGGKPQLFIISEICGDSSAHNIIKMIFGCHKINELKYIASTNEASSEFVAGVHLLSDLP